jgi:hypothetical protein
MYKEQFATNTQDMFQDTTGNTHVATTLAKHLAQQQAQLQLTAAHQLITAHQQLAASN